MVTVRQEIGWVYLRGPVQFPPGYLDEAPNLEISSLAREFAKRWSDPSAAHMQVFVSDEETCSRLASRIERWRILLNQNRTLPPEALRAFGHSNEEKRVAVRFLRTAAIRAVPDADHIQPQYQMAVCLPPGAENERLRDLLRGARNEELFGTAAYTTGRLYAEACALAAFRSDSDTMRITWDAAGQLDWHAPTADPKGMWSPIGFGNSTTRGGFDWEKLKSAFENRLHEVVTSELAATLGSRLVGERDQNVATAGVAERTSEIAEAMTAWLMPPHWRNKHQSERLSSFRQWCRTAGA
jgi:hypothetical protein